MHLKPRICVFLEFTLFLTVDSVNYIDVNKPIVITESFSEKLADSSFGYTVSLLKYYTGNNYPSLNIFPGSEKRDSTVPPTGWVFIGAPKGNYTSSNQRNYRNGNVNVHEPGIIWRCSLGNPQKEYCQTVDLQIPDTQSTPTCTTRSPHHRCFKNEDQEEGWFGGSMSTSMASSHGGNGNNLVGCGFRWGRTGDKTNAATVNGICYWVEGNDISSENLIGIHSKKKALKPLIDESKEFYNVPNSVQRDYEWYFGQAGFSSHLTAQNNLILGAPGVHTWSGSVIYYRDFSNPRPVILQPEYFENIKPLDLFGYSITSGRFMQQSEIMFAVGAPRAVNMLGSVAVFAPPTRDDFYYSFNNEKTLKGVQYSSYFGSVLSAVDFDGNNLDELLVGAPFYGTQDFGGDHGCVFIYRYDIYSRDFQSPFRICASTPMARFGSAITSLGDINNDGFKDFAVGAPYENDGKGAVYVYLGRSPILRDINPDQKIEPLTSVTGRGNTLLLAFGSSLHGDVDIDDNGTPDLAIGSYESKAVVIYRTRPTLSVQTGSARIHFIINNVKAAKFSRNDNRITAKFCLELTAKPTPKSTTRLNVWVNFSVDKFFRRFSIISEISSKPTRVNEMNGGYTIEFSAIIPLQQLHCMEILMEKDKEFDPVIPAHQMEIPVEARVWYNETLNPAIQTVHLDISKSPNTGKPEVKMEGHSFTDFCNSCPTPITFPPVKESLSIAQDDCNNNGNPDCESNLQFSEIYLTDDLEQRLVKNAKNQYRFTIGSSKWLTLKINLLNKGETAYSPIVEIKGEFQDIQPLKKERCGPTKDKEIFQCKIGHPLHKNKNFIEEIQLDTSTIFANNLTESFTIAVAAFPLEQQSKFSKSQGMTILLEGDATVSLTGTSSTHIREYSVSETSHTSIFHRYSASIRGVSPVSSVRMKFLIPVKMTNKGSINELILVSKPTAAINCRPTKGNFSELQLEHQTGWTSFSNASNGTSIGIVSRRKRASPDPQGITSFNVLCGQQKDWQCMVVLCETRLQANGAVNVEFKLHIDNNIAKKFIKESHKNVYVKSEGSVAIFSENNDKHKKAAISETILTIEAEKEFPVWIAIVSGIGGLILLLLITICLAKCGFFRRKTRENLRALKAKSTYDPLAGEHFPNLVEDDDG